MPAFKVHHVHGRHRYPFLSNALLSGYLVSRVRFAILIIEGRPGSAWPPLSFPSTRSSGHRMAHFEFGQNRLTQAHPLHTFDLAQSAIKGAFVLFSTTLLGLVRFVCKITFFRRSGWRGIATPAAMASTVPTPSSGSSKARRSLEGELSPCFSGCPSLTSAGCLAGSGSLKRQSPRKNLCNRLGRRAVKELRNENPMLDGILAALRHPFIGFRMLGVSAICFRLARRRSLGRFFRFPLWTCLLSPLGQKLCLTTLGK